MKRLGLFAAAFLLIATVSLAASASDVNASRAKNTSKISLPSFPYEQGWFGSDAAYSVPLSPTTSLWYFGDTFVTDPSVTERSKYKAMVRNSIGISTCEPDKPCTMQYYWGGQNTDRPVSFFDSGKQDEWYWPQDSYVDGDTLYSAFMIMRTKKGSGPDDPFGFELAGSRWFTIRNVHASPEKWVVESKILTEGNVNPGVSILADGKFVLFYTLVNTSATKGFMTVLRVPRGKIADPAASWEYIGNDKKWHAGSPKDDALVVIDQPISEMSVRYHAPAKKFVAISNGGPEFPTTRIFARTADSPIGPWSKPYDVFFYPEMDPSNPIYDKDTDCYAAKEHIEFGDSQIVLTYSCNSLVVQKVVDNMQLYRPHAVVVDVPQ